MITNDFKDRKFILKQQKRRVENVDLNGKLMVKYAKNVGIENSNKKRS